MRTHLDLGPDLDDAAVVGDELLGRHTEGGVADHRLDAAVQPGEDQDSAGTLGSCRVKEVTTFPSLSWTSLPIILPSLNTTSLSSCLSVFTQKKMLMGKVMAKTK